MQIGCASFTKFIWIEKLKLSFSFESSLYTFFLEKKTVDVPCTFIVKNTLKVDTCCKKGKCFFLSTFSPRQYVNKNCTNPLTRIFNLYLCLNEILFNGFTGVALTNCASKFKRGVTPRKIIESEISANLLQCFTKFFWTVLGHVL